MSEREFDVVVIGAGPAGEVCAGRLGDAGLEVAIVERRLIGGECSYYACMPSKALLRGAEALAEVERIPGAREAVTGVLDVQSTLDRRDEVIHDLDDSSQLPWLEERGIAVVRGHGRITGARRVQVGEDMLVARKAVVVAVGSVAAVPPIPGLREAEPWTNIEMTTAKAAPGRLLVLGGGVAGVEMAQAWAGLGSDVALVEAVPRLIAHEEEFASEQVEEALRELGVDVRTGVKATGARRTADGGVDLDLEGGETLSGDELFVSVGRTPHTEDLGLDAVGLEPGKPVEVDASMRAAGHDWLYAIGDANGRVLLTHMGKYQGRIAADHILGRDTALQHGADGPLSPRVIFTNPQVAAVGHTAGSAEEAGLNVRCVEQPTSGNAGGSFHGHDATGTARLVVDEDRGVIVGATFTGAEIAEFVHAATIAVVAEVPMERLRHAVPSFPTRSEVWLGLLAEYGL